jgi:hypothetical protein
METVSNLASSASKAIWGDQTTAAENATTGNETAGREPVAGETGDVNAGEPYDKGNLGKYFPAPNRLNQADRPDSTGTDPAPLSSTTNASTSLSNKTSATGPIGAEHETDKVGVTPYHNPTPLASSKDPSGAKTQQGAGQPIETPSSEQVAKVDTSAPGPKSLGTKATSGSVATAGGQESRDEGTGQKHVESTGFVADGGNFDASKPGAGKEADRECSFSSRWIEANRSRVASREGRPP